MLTNKEKSRTGKASKLVSLYAVLVFTLVSLYYENNYADMIEAKAGITVIVLSLLITFGIVFMIREKQFIQKQKISAIDVAVFAFAGSSVISTLISQLRFSAFFGTNGWQVGTFQIVLLGLAYYIVSRNFVPRKGVFICSCAGIFIVLIIAVLNGLGIDVFGMHTGLSDSVSVNYLSTIGNINTFSGYLCLVLFFLVGSYVKYTGKLIRATCAVLVFLASFCAFLCNSDSFWLGALFAAVVVGLYIRRAPEKTADFFGLGLVFSFASFIVSVLTFTDLIKTDFDGFTGFYIQHRIWIFCLIFFAVMQLVCKKFEAFINKRINILTGGCLILFGLVFTALVIYAVCHFDDTWGTFRGFIWKNSFAMFRQFNLKSKIFGVGTDCFGIVFNSCFGEQITEIYKMPVLNAHNEFLQYLITNGFFGVCSYGALYFCVIYDEIKNSERGIVNINAVLPICAYFGQALLNNPHMMNYIILFLFISYVKKSSANMKGLVTYG